MWFVRKEVLTLKVEWNKRARHGVSYGDEVMAQVPQAELSCPTNHTVSGRLSFNKPHGLVSISVRLQSALLIGSFGIH